MELKELIFCDFGQPKELNECIMAEEIGKSRQDCPHAYFLIRGKKSGLNEGIPVDNMPGGEIDCPLRLVTESGAAGSAHGLGP